MKRYSPNNQDTEHIEIVTGKPCSDNPFELHQRSLTFPSTVNVRGFIFLVINCKIYLLCDSKRY